MLTTNALVTYTDLSTMGLVPKGSPATGNRIATKSFINSNYYVNQSASPYNTYTSLRCPPYQTIVPGPTNSGTMYYTINYGGGNIHGFNTPAEACAHSTGGSITVYWSGTFGNGTAIYLDPDGITQLDGFNYFSLGGYSFGVDVATVIEYTACPSNAITNVFGSAYDILGEIYIGASVFITNVVTSDTTFDVVVFTDTYGDVTVFVTITSGNNSGSGETYVGMGSTASVFGQCISGCSDPSISLTGFTC